MPHYADGTQAEIGDVVQGTGYNVKTPIVGTIVQITPGTSCNVQIAHVVIDEFAKSRFHWPDNKHFHQLCPLISSQVDGKPMRAARVSIEYGQADAFQLVHRPNETEIRQQVAAAFAQAEKETAEIRRQGLVGERRGMPL